MTHTPRTIDRIVDLIDPDSNVLLDCTYDEAAERIANGDVEAVGQIHGQFAIVQKRGRTVRMARSIGRPMRYFLAKLEDGPLLIVSERIDQICDYLRAHNLDDQFHPSYTRMVPAHFVVSIELVGCPDPNPRYDRYFAPERANLPADLDDLGHRYVSRLSEACDRWLDGIDPREPIGVLFSGGVDSGALFLILQDRLLRRGEVPTRLKAFTLQIEDAPDSRQAFDFLNRLDMSMYLEVIEASREDVDFRKAVRLIEDYKPLDVQAAAMAFALCGGIRKAYPDWKYLVDGDGGDENLKDYPIEENPELTIRSVLNNSMLYHEGWGVHAIKHSLTYTGGQSRGHVRSYAPAAHFGFRAFSPYALTSVIEVSEGIPYVELTDWDHERLYALKGEIVSRGVEQLTGHEMPVFEKRRFQHGAVSADRFDDLFPADEAPYRAALADAYR